MNKKIEDEIEKTWQLGENLHRAEMPAFFYTRLKARMENELISSPKTAWLLKPAFVVPILLLVLSINVLTVSTFIKERKGKEAAVSSQKAFQNEYQLNTTYGVNLY